MTLLWLRFAVLLYGIAALAVVPAALYDRPRWRHLAVPVTVAAALFHFVSLAETLNAAHHRLPIEAHEIQSLLALILASGVSARLCLVSQRVAGDSCAAGCLHPGDAGCLSQWAGDVLRAASYGLDMAAHRASAGGVCRAGCFAACVGALPYPGAAAEVALDEPSLAFARWTRRLRPSTRLL